jgi:hypothetical protein
MRVRHIAICGLSGSTIFFHIISNTARFSKKKVIEHNMFFLQLLSQTFLILGTTEQEIIKNVYSSLREVPVILARC